MALQNWQDIWGDIFGDIWMVDGDATLPSAPFSYTLVTPGTLTRQDFPAAAAAIVDTRNYVVPEVDLGDSSGKGSRRKRQRARQATKVILDNGATPVDWRGFTVTLPAVTRTDN